MNIDHADSSGSLWKFKRDEQNMNNGNPADVTADGSSSFKYKSSFIKNLVATNVTTVGDVAARRILHNAKIAVPLKY